MSEPKPRSFWGRVTEFVKNPTQDWALTKHEDALREQQEQEQIRAKEEQRKLDAFIRRRELASLRRLRKRQEDGLPLDEVFTDLPDTGTGPSAPERAATLRKIDEIEQAMAAADVKPPPLRPKSVQHPPAPLDPKPPHVTEADAIRLGSAADRAATRQIDVSSGAAQQGSTPANALRNGESGDIPPKPAGISLGEATMSAATAVAATQLAPTQVAPTQAAATVMGLTLFAADHPPMDTWVKTGGYASSSSMAVDVQEGVSSSPLFDQACIDFANGQDEDAERALLEAISGSPDRELENEFWLALFDLYRASNNTAKFEALVADYVDRFQSSAPSWEAPLAAKPASNAPSAPAGAAAVPAPVASASAAFTALGELDAAQSRALLLLARSGAPQVALDFTALTAIEAGAQTAAVDALKTLNAASNCVIELGGIENLIAACAAAAPPMERDADPDLWALRLEALRLADDQETFENVALDYCVTYEISPPTWEASRAKIYAISHEMAPGSSTLPMTQPPAGALPSQFNTHFGNTGAGVAVVPLRGEIKGGSEDFLKPLDAASAGQAGMVVNLTALRRMDFASAGIMLNWVMAQSSAGRSVQFENTHRLIAGLFVILGINSVAQIQLRKF